MKIRICIFLLLFIFPANVFTEDYFISSSGSDYNPGTETRPWKTIEMINRKMNTFRPGDRILFRRGDIFLGELRISKSGTAENPLIFGSYGDGELPVISGIRQISGWIRDSGKIWTAELTSAPETLNGLVINGEFQPLARYPDIDDENTGYLEIEDHSGKRRIKFSGVRPLNDITGCEAVIRTTFWLLDRIKIKKQDGLWIDLANNATYELKDGFGFFLQNHPSFLSRHGEWYYDSDTRKISLYWDPPYPAGPNDALIEAPVIDKPLVINGPEHVEIRDLHVYGSGKTSVSMFNCSHIDFHDNKIELSAAEGFNIYNARNFNISSCIIDKTQSIAFQTGNFRFAEFSGNLITDTGLIPGMGMSGICKYNAMFLMGDDYAVKENMIFNTGYMPIDFKGNNVLIENNVIDNYCFTVNDGGGIYVYSEAEEYENRVISGNIITGGRGCPDGTATPDLNQVCGIYMDEAAVNVEIRENIITGINGEGIYIHNARSMYVHDNISADNRTQFSMVQDKTDFCHSIRNCRIENNTFFSASPQQLLVRQLSVRDDLFQFGTYKGNSYHLLYESKGNIEMEFWPGRYFRFNSASWPAHDSSGNWTLHGNEYYTEITAAGGSLIKNSSFDKDTTGWGTWSPAGNTAISRETENGNGHLKFIFTKESAVTNNRGQIFSYLSDIHQGDCFLFEFDCKADQPGKPYMVTFQKEGGSWDNIDEPRLLFTTDSWSHHEILLKAGFDNASARIYINVPENMDAFRLDNVSFTKVQVKESEPESLFRIEINDTELEKNIPLSGIWYDLTGKKVSGTLRLSPFSAVILIKK